MSTGICPCPDGTCIYEGSYDGYGHFGGHDIYELVADWNRKYISVSNLRIPHRSSFCTGQRGNQAYIRAVERYKKMSDCISDFTRGSSDNYMAINYGEDWKREIGIAIAVYDSQNITLKFPIKICSHESVYEDVCASGTDPKQGCD